MSERTVSRAYAGRSSAAGAYANRPRVSAEAAKRAVHKSRHISRRHHIGLLRKYKNEVETLAILLGFLIMMAGCALIVKSLSIGLIIFMIGFGIELL